MMITVQNVLMGMMISLRRGDNVLNSINKIDGVVDGIRNDTTKTSDANFASLVFRHITSVLVKMFQLVLSFWHRVNVNERFCLRL